MCELTRQQIEGLATPLSRMAIALSSFYDNEEHEAAYQQWHLRKFERKGDTIVREYQSHKE